MTADALQSDISPFESHDADRTTALDRTAATWGEPAMIDLVSSAEPAVVFSSLAMTSVPRLCDAVVIDVVEDAAHYRITHPPGSTSASALPDGQPIKIVQVSFSDRSAPYAQDLRDGTHGADDRTDDRDAQPHFDGVAEFAWHDRVPTAVDEDMVAGLIDRAVLTVMWQRSEQRAQSLSAKADNLQIALQTSRLIGTALGVLMSHYKLTSEQSLELLRHVSQHSHRKLREVAAEVIDSGWLEQSLSGAG